MAPAKGGNAVPSKFSMDGSPIASAMKKKAESILQQGKKKGIELKFDYDPYTDPDWWNQGYIYGGVVPRDGFKVKLGDDPQKSKLADNYNLAQDHVDKMA